MISGSEFKAEPVAVRFCKVLPNFNRVLTIGQFASSVKIWDATTFELCTTIETRNLITAYVLLPENEIALGHDFGVSVWSLTTGAQIRSYLIPDLVLALVVTPNGFMAVTSNALYLWEPDEGVIDHDKSYSLKHQLCCFNLADGRILLAQIGKNFLDYWCIGNTSSCQTYQLKDAITAIDVFSSDDVLLAFASKILLRHQGKDQVFAIRSPCTSVVALDDIHFVSAHANGDICIWNRAMSKPIYTKNFDGAPLTLVKAAESFGYFDAQGRVRMIPYGDMITFMRKAFASDAMVSSTVDHIGDPLVCIKGFDDPFERTAWCRLFSLPDEKAQKPSFNPASSVAKRVG